MFRKRKQQLNYVGKEITHTPDTIGIIPSGVLNCLAKTTSLKPTIHSEGVDKIYSDHVNALQKAGLATSYFPTMEDLWIKQDEKVDLEKEPDVNKNTKNKCLLFVAHSRYFSMSIHRVINNLSWMRVRMSYHRFNNVAELLNGYLAAKSRRGNFSKDLIDREFNCSLPSEVNEKCVYNLQIKILHV